MLSVTIQIHRHILSSQCCIRYEDSFHVVDSLQVSCMPSKLSLSLLRGAEIIREVHITTPTNFFIPSSLSSDQIDSVDSGSTLMCPTSQISSNQFIADLRFRLKVSSIEKLCHSNIEVPVDVKNFFRERFQKHKLWDFVCGSCGCILSEKSLSFDSLKEFSESELSEGWFCHKMISNPIPQWSSQVLYMDDVSFFLDHHFFKSQDSLSTNLKSNMNCPKCGILLGVDKAPHSLRRFFFDKLMLTNSSMNEDPAKYVHKVILLSFWNLFEKSSASSIIVKLFLYNKEEDMCLLLWIPTEKISQFHLAYSAQDFPLETHLESTAVYKVLYFVGDSSSDSVRSWRHDFTVDYYCVSDTLIKTVVEMLKKSSQHAPQVPDPFSHGFLTPINASLF
ncbi:uncharacterized protein TNIN_493871 [Trichonephila inaurata madagascariensis]|uniref:Ubiquitin-conjugating enzyme E2C-binding protein n=1 Tax=Trichonephila inaurata madagascariensis TaxID=2747483 RepID=A0A8X6WMV3_9ARAC|nr:uncharacterized protein TNIN_493871 [Trichonephila inaurata madagascariensis]